MSFGFRAVVVGGGAAALAVVGCSALVTFDALVGQGDAPLDARAEAAASAVDDAHAGDTGAADAAGDAAPESARFCQTVKPPPTFCADFDAPDAGAAADGWDSQSVGAQTMLSLSTAKAQSPPRALDAVSSTGQSGYLQKDLPVTTLFALDADLFVAKATPTGAMAPIGLTSASGYQLSFFLSDSFYCQLGGSEFSSHAKIVVGEWTHLSVRIALAPGSMKVTCVAGGVTLWTDYAAKSPWTMPASASVIAGFAFMYMVTSPTQVYLDNVVVTAQ